MVYIGSADDDVKARLIEQLGNIVHKIHFLPLVTFELTKNVRRKLPGLVAGMVMDLTTDDPDINRPRDFSLRSKRDKARDMVRRTKRSSL